MTVNPRSHTSGNKTEVDAVERELISKGFRPVTGFAELREKEYHRSEGSANGDFTGPTIYTIDWRECDS